MSESVLYDGKEIKFNISKILKYTKKLGSGGTGDTHLLYDDIANKYFAIKKFVPKGGNDSDDCFKRFIDEIKILMDISHKNIVRIYNYYLYPAEKTGYIQMEYIDGKCIDDFVPMENKKWEDLFIDAIDAFMYLERRNILHRDIRVNNFLINEDNELIIIDFGFGKKYDESNFNENSILLNWPGTQTPEEIKVSKTYDARTEIYYLGLLFKKIVSLDFSYNDILNKMCQVQTNLRFQSFKEVKDALNKSLFLKIDFNNDEKKIYKTFSNQIYDSLTKFNGSVDYNNDINKIMNDLEHVITSNSLEDLIQGNDNVISCFVKSSYTYKRENIITYLNVLEFYKLMIRMSDSKKEIIIENLQAKLSNRSVEYSSEEDLPF